MRGLVTAKEWLGKAQQADKLEFSAIFFLVAVRRPAFFLRLLGLQALQFAIRMIAHVKFILFENGCYSHSHPISSKWLNQTPIKNVGWVTEWSVYTPLDC